MIDDSVLLELAKAVAKKRGYADFFDWPDKRQKELGLLETLLEAAGRLGLELSDAHLEVEGMDPPDAWATFAGARVAIELTEFVDEELIIKRRVTGHTQYRDWTASDVTQELARIIANKDHTGFGAKSPYWLVIHCDEPTLTAGMLDGYLKELSPFPVIGVSKCFVLFSYDPGPKHYPLVEVPILRAA